MHIASSDELTPLASPDNNRAMTRQTLLATLSLLIAIATGCTTQHTSATDSGVSLRPGDLLFQDLDGSPLCDAIEAVTTGYENTRLSHVAMVVDTQPQVQVVEAVGSGVKITPLNQFLARSHDGDGRPKVLVGRLHKQYRDLIPQAVTYAKAQLGKPYDKPFTMGEDSFYCSELIYFAFLHADHGKPVFSTAPMTFKDPSTGDFFPAWVDYYNKLGVRIPEGQPGMNPGSLSREPAVTIIYAYGRPANK